MIPEKAWDLVPDQIDATDWALRVANRAELSGNSRRAYLLATNLISQFLDRFEDLNYLTSPFLERFKILDISAGFIPKYSQRSLRQLDFSQYDDYAFGVVIGVDSRFVHRGFPFGEFGGNGIYPFIIEERNIAYDAPPNIVSPSTAVSSCYVKPKAGKTFYYYPTWASGILTVRHAIQPTYLIGTSISMSNGTTNTVAEVDTYSSTIDAAILDCGTVPSTVSPLSIVTGLAPGDSVNIRTSGIGFTASVLRIFEHPSSFSALFGHRVFIDNVGVPGDSGSLITKTVNGNKEAVGIYMGRTCTFPDEGVVQSMRQIANAFEVDIFD